MNQISALNSLLAGLDGQRRSQSEASQLQYSSQSFSLKQSSDGTTEIKQVSFSYEGVYAAQRRGAHKVLGQSVESHFSELKLSTPSAPVFEPPDPQEVANRILGFVENRLQAEADAGASPEKLDNLLSQARKGVEKGFGQARNDIEKLGLMTDELGQEIDQSFSLVNDGLDKLQERFTGSSGTASSGSDVLAAPDSSEESEAVADDELSEPAASSASSQNSVNSYRESIVDIRSSQSQKQSRIEQADGGERTGRSDPAERGGIQRFNGLQENAAIEIRTQDGDIVSISLQQLSASYDSARYVDGPGNLGISRESQSLFAGDYQLNVTGSLDQGEMTALNDLLTQIQDLAQQFFNGDFEAAYNAALDIGFDDSEIAAFAVDLSQTQVQQVSTYQFKPDQAASSQAFKPLAQAADGLSQALDRAQIFDQGVSLMQQLLDRMLADQQAAKADQFADPNSATTLPVSEQPLSAQSDRINNFIDQVLQKLGA